MHIITVTGYKGGVGKSTTAIHLAAYFSDFGKTIVVDSDPNRSSLEWAEAGKLTFEVFDERRAMKQVQRADYVVIDTSARPNTDDLAELAKGCDLLVLPCLPDALSLKPLLKAVKQLNSPYRVLLTAVPPLPNRNGETMRRKLESLGIALFKTEIKRSVAFGEASEKGITVAEVADYRQRSAWYHYERVGNEIRDLLRLELAA